MQIEKTVSSCFELCFDSKLEEVKNKTTSLPHHSPKSYYTLRYFFNPSNTFFHLFMHTKVYDKTTNENIEKRGILLRSWNPITKRGERYVFKKGDEGEGDLNLKRVYLPNTKTIFEFSFDENNYESSYRLAEEIIEQSPHKDIEIKFLSPK
ncbi:MAG: hypothetical protein K0S93_2219 [Nitrososphaeraceae archaeon]|nr:hypothetical protein [Nitrososphaeraceae archaeon]